MTKKYCYREPDFPAEGYVALVFVTETEEGKLRFLYPMMPLFPSLAVLRTNVKHLKKQLGRAKKMSVYGLIVAKVNLTKKFPLRKEHSASPQPDLFEKEYRILRYQEMMKNMPQLYSVIVLPCNYEVKLKEWTYVNWIPMLMTTSDEKIDNLIKMSDQPVDESAKSIGIYSVEYTRGFDLKTGKLIYPENTGSSKEADC